MYIDLHKKNNKGDRKFKVGDHVRISKYKNISAKGYVPNWSEEVFVITKVKNAVPRTYVDISDLKDKEIVKTFYEMKFQKNNQKEFRMEKKLKEKAVNYMLNWKGYDNSFNSWIDKKDYVTKNGHSLLAAPKDGRTRKNLEGFFIAKLKPSLNRQKDSDMLTLFRNGVT